MPHQFRSSIVFGLAFVCFAPLASAQTVNVDLDAEKQIIRGYGGINHPAWIGDLTAAQRETAFGNGPNQIGMTVLRMYIDDNSANWERNVATAKRAQELGATLFASPWNPPAAMTEVVNGAKRLRYDQYDEYATHLNAYYTFMRDRDVDLFAISVQNEPDYAEDWTAWTPQEILRFMKENATSIQTKVIAPESFQYRKVMSDPILNDPVALANLDVLGAHLYGTQLRDFPYPLFKEKGAGKELWMTEVYTESQRDADEWPLALDVATNIHNSMVEAEFNAYVWWYIRRSYGPIKENGQISKRGYCMAHFSKFVRPEFRRVDATRNPTSGVLVSAYKGETDVIVVVVNNTDAPKTLQFSVTGRSIDTYEKFTTSSTKSLSADGNVEPTNGAFSVSFDGRSVTTLRGHSEATGTGGAEGTGGSDGGGSGGAAPGGAGGTPGAGGGDPSGTGGAPGTGGADPSGTGGSTPGGIGGTSSGSGGLTSTGGAPTGSGGGPGGVDDGANDPSAGCGCQTVGGGSTPLWGAMGLFGAWILAARRRQPSSSRS